MSDHSITSLIEKLEGAEPNDAWVFAPDVHLALFGGSLGKAARCPKYTASLDAALALAERVVGGKEALLLLTDLLTREADASDFDLITVSDIPRLLCAAVLRAQSEARATGEDSPANEGEGAS